MPINFIPRTTDYVPESDYAHFPMDIWFDGSIDKEDVAEVSDRLKEIVIKNPLWGVQMIHTVFEDLEAELEIIAILMLGKASSLEFINVSLRGGIWNKYFQSSAIENVRQLEIKYVTDSVMYEGTFWNTIVGAISRFRLEKIVVHQGGETQYWPNGISRLVSDLDKTLLTAMKLEIPGLAQSHMESLCKSLRGCKVLECLLISQYDPLSPDFLGDVLKSCLSLNIISVFFRGVGLVDPSIDFRWLGDVVFCHPNIKHIVGGFSDKRMRYFQRMMCVKKNMDAFRSRHVKRVSMRSSVRKLFGDVDRLLFNFLA